jgi:hypothetical protein
MNTFHWLLILGFPAEVAANGSVPSVFAAESAVTANDLAAFAEHRESPPLAQVMRDAAA